MWPLLLLPKDCLNTQCGLQVFGDRRSWRGLSPHASQRGLPLPRVAVKPLGDLD
jgi:hypothetical protein